MDNDQIKLKKKKTSKKIITVPSSNLGFTIKLNTNIIDPRKIKKKINKHKKKYIQKSNKQHFMTRLRMVIDINQLPTDLQSHLFKITKKSDWNYVKKVYYRTRQKVYCNICLEQNIIAPQITYCGHIYCFHCILMHFKISKNCFTCPVCKQITDKNQLRTCQIKYDCQININDQITLDLKYRQGQYIYDADTLTQDLNCADIIRMRTKGIIPIFQLQLDQLKKQLSITLQKDRNYQYLIQAIQITTQKLQNLKKIINNHPHLRQNELIKNQIIYRFIKQQQKHNLTKFYQQKSGSFIYLHKLCKKYIHFNQNFYQSIKSTILYKQQIDFQSDQNFYKQIPILYNNLQIYAIIININKYTTEQKLTKFNNQFQLHIKNIQKQQKQQQLELERLRIQYEEDQSYIRKLKEQEQSEFYFDVRLSPSLNPCDINQNSFPSLITHIPNPPEPTQNQKQKQKQKQKQTQIQHQTQPIIIPLLITSQKQQKIQQEQPKQIEQFPHLSQISPLKTQLTITKSIKNGKKKKKGKFVDVTQSILFNYDQQTQQ